MKTLSNLIISATLICFISYSATGQKFEGYWLPSSTNTMNKGIICFKIQKNGSLYSVEHYFNSGEMERQGNLTLSSSGNILETKYGTYKYVSGNDVLLNVFFQTPPTFKRITMQKFTELTASYVQSQKQKEMAQKNFVDDPNDIFSGVYSAYPGSFIIIKAKGANEYTIRFKGPNEDRTVIGQRSGNTLYRPVINNRQIALSMYQYIVVRNNRVYTHSLMENSGSNIYCRLNSYEVIADLNEGQNMYSKELMGEYNLEFGNCSKYFIATKSSDFIELVGIKYSMKHSTSPEITYRGIFIKSPNENTRYYFSDDSTKTISCPNLDVIEYNESNRHCKYVRVK